jgi:hypothetical protein
MLADCALGQSASVCNKSVTVVGESAPSHAAFCPRKGMRSGLNTYSPRCTRDVSSQNIHAPFFLYNVSIPARLDLTVICRGCLTIDLSAGICVAVHENCSQLEFAAAEGCCSSRGEGTMRSIVFAACALALAGCATAYQPIGFAGGYSEVQLNADTYQIR